MAIIFISLSLEDENSKIFLNMEWNDCAQTLENNPRWLILVPGLPVVLLVLWRAPYSYWRIAKVSPNAHKSRQAGNIEKQSSHLSTALIKLL